MCVGEKLEERENGTLSILMTSPVSVLNLVVAKYVYVILGGLTSLALNLVSIALFMRLGSSLMKFDISIASPVGVSISTFLLAATIASVALAAGSLAKSRNQGQGILTVLMAVFLIPVFLGGVTKEINLLTALIPFYSALVSVAQSVNVGVSTGYLTLTIISNLLFIGFMLGLSKQFFRKNKGNKRHFFM